MDESAIIVLLTMLGSILFVVPLVWFARRQHQAFRETMAEVARRHDLQHTPATFFKGSRVEGEIDGHNVLVDTYTVSTGKSSTTYTRVRVGTTADPALSLGAEGMFSRLGSALGATDIEVGDPVFDHDVRVHGDEAAVRGLLDAPTRAAVHRAVGSGAALKEGTWTLSVGGLVTDPEKLDRLVRVVVHAATALRHAQGRGVDGGLHHVVGSDPCTPVRLRCLAALRRRGGFEPSALAPLLDDPEPRLRLEAARLMGAVDAALALLDTSVGLDAATWLAGTPWEELDADARDRVQLALLAVLDVDEPLAPALDAIGRRGTVDHVPMLREASARWPRAARRRAESAVHAIQERSGAEHGGLSMVAADGGELSEATEADAERGRLAEAARTRRTE